MATPDLWVKEVSSNPDATVRVAEPGETPDQTVGVRDSGYDLTVRVVTGKADFIVEVVEGAFAPSIASIPNMTGWWKADALSLADNATVSSWPDSSPNGKDLSQATSGARPTFKTNIINGLPVVRFADGKEIARFINRDELFSSDAITIFVVQYQLGSDNENTTILWDQETPANNRVVIHASYQDDFYFDYGSAEAGRISGDQPVGWDDAWHLLRCRRAESAAHIAVDGSVVVSGTMSDALDDMTAPFSIGYAGFASGFGGDIAEVIIFNRALTTEEISQVEVYLTEKYAL